MSRAGARVDALTSREVGRLLGLAIHGVTAREDLVPVARIGAEGHRRYRLEDVAAWAELHARGRPAPVRIDDLTRRIRVRRPVRGSAGMRHPARDARVLELRRAGWGWSAIGAEVGLTGWAARLIVKRLDLRDRSG